MKFRLKITLAMLCLLAVLFGAGGSALIAISYQTSLDREKDSAFNSYQMLLNTLSIVSSMNVWKDKNDISNTLEQLYAQRNSSMSALRLSTAERTLYAGGVIFQQVSLVENTQYCEIFNYKDDKGAHYLHLSGAFLVGDELHFLEATYDISAVYAVRTQQQETYYQIFGAMVFVCAILAYTISWLLTRPLLRLSKASREIARGNLGFRSQIHTNDEVGLLSADFDTMAEQVEDSISGLQAAMERQEQFMGSFAHEMKNPMTSIIGYAELIRNQSLTQEEQMDAAHFIFSEGKRLESLSLKLLDILVADNQDIKFTSVSPAKLIANLLKHLQPLYKHENILLYHKCEEGVCRLEPDLVKSLLINLLDNAKKSIKGEGKILVMSQMVEDGCKICVADTGKGIPDDALHRITEAFYRVDKSRAREQGGAGLGLTLCTKIAALHNGELYFDSKEGQGTQVTVILRGGKA